MSQNEKKIQNIIIKRLKTSSIKIVVTPHGVEVHIPEGCDESKAMEAIDRHRLWIERRVQELARLTELSEQLETVERSVEELREIIRGLAEQVATELLGISNPCRIVVREMSKKWASLSGKCVLTVNKLARHLPEPLLKYIVYHEICHIIERKHNNKFWSCVEKLIPDYKELETKLRAYEIKLAQHELSKAIEKD